MWYWYTEYYERLPSSQANSTFCEQAYGKDLGQHGFMDMAQLQKLLEVACLDLHHQVLDLGCGNGMIAEYISDTSGALVTGVDFIPEAILQAQERTAAKRERLAFIVGNLDCLDFTPASFDTLISIDSLYFTSDLVESLRQLKSILEPGGQMLIFYSYGATPDQPRERFNPVTLSPGRTPLGEALSQNGLAFQTWDYTQADYQHGLRCKAVLADLKPAFEAEGSLFIFENRLGEAVGITAAIEAGLHARYLYHIKT
jgi:cyclopropane fatty-acyl-phospholipid synthase-like methyltransferase